jgi:hypothetical protein
MNHIEPMKGKLCHSRDLIFKTLANHMALPMTADCAAEASGLGLLLKRSPAHAALRNLPSPEFSLDINPRAAS